MQDIRLDFITNIEPVAIELMTDIRQKFIALDRAIVDFQESYPNISNGHNQQAARCASIARTHIETACQYAIKALCLCGEQK